MVYLSTMSAPCITCEKSKAHLTCGLCDAALCKSCAEFLADDQFLFLENPSADLSHEAYCRNCFEQTVAPKIADYEELMEKARDIRVYFKNQSQETRTIKRKSPAVNIVDCTDYHEAILRLAFLAAQTGHNAVVDLNLTPKKVRQNSYQSTVWSGSALPVVVDAKRLARDLPDIGNPN